MSHLGKTNTIVYIYVCLVIRAFVPTLELHSLFEQKYEIAKAVVVGLDKVFLCLLNWFGTSKLHGRTKSSFSFFFFLISSNFLCTGHVSIWV
jgi:hypothetical protein